MTGLLLLAVLVELGVVAYLLQNPTQHDRIRPVMTGLGFTLLLCLLTFWRNLPLAAFQRTIVLLATLWMFVNVHSLMVTHRPVTSGMLLHMAMLALLAFSWLPPRWAIGLVVTTYVLLSFGATYSTIPDLAGLLLLGFLLVLTWFLTLHGNHARSERVRNQHLAELAATDALTSLSNRRAGQEQLEHLILTWRHQPDCLCVLVLDLDRFKCINDSMGHARGDEVLVAVSRVLKNVTHEDDVVVRWGGEEFLIVISGRRASKARETGQRILSDVRGLSLPGFPRLSISGGLAFLSEADHPRALLALADQRLYQAKAAGRDQLI